MQDLSLEPVNKYLEKKPKEPVYLISYADGADVFFQNQHFLVHSALNKGIDHFLNYRRSHVNAQFIKDHQEIFDTPLGAGLWLWKPWVILETLKNTPENAIIMYADVGFCFGGSLNQLWERLKDADMVMVYYQNWLTPDQCLKPKILAQHTIDESKFFKKGNFWAGFMVIRNNEKSRKFIKTWLDLCCKKNYLSGESFGPGKHLHDQAILYLAYALRDENIKIGYIKNTELDQWLPWHHRKETDKHQSLMPYLKKYFRAFERIAWNVSGLSRLRYFYRNHVKTRLDNITEKGC